MAKFFFLFFTAYENNVNPAKEQEEKPCTDTATVALDRVRVRACVTDARATVYDVCMHMPKEEAKFFLHLLFFSLYN